ncbi:MAG TPA: hypothetical protein VF484_03275, partial [Candidatus Limnocylindrales bacterium]
MTEHREELREANDGDIGRPSPADLRDLPPAQANRTTDFGVTRPVLEASHLGLLAQLAHKRSAALGSSSDDGGSAWHARIVVADAWPPLTSK